MEETTPAVTPAGPDDATPTPTNTKPAGPDVQTGAPAGPDTTTPDDADTSLVASLRRENASWRTKAREYETKVTDLTTRLQELESTSGPSTDEKASVATLKRQIDDLTQKLAKQEADAQAHAERARQKTLQAALSTVITSAQLNEPQTALRLLSDVAKVADDDVVVFSVKDAEGKVIEVEATADNLRQYNLLPAIYFPPEGVPGTGSKGTKQVATGTVDLSKAGDFAYYRNNHEAIKAARRNQNR